MRNEEAYREMSDCLTAIGRYETWKALGANRRLRGDKMTPSTAINNLLTNHPAHTIDPKADSYDWGLVVDHPGVERMLIEAKRLATGILLDETPRWLTLLGISGTGKTHLADRLLAFWRARWRCSGVVGMPICELGSSRKISWMKFISRQRNGEYSELQSLSELPFVVIDDIGADDGTPFARSKLYSLLDARLGKWTVITSNLGMKELASIDTRIASRMIRGESVVVETDLKDWNLRRKKV